MWNPIGYDSIDVLTARPKLVRKLATSTGIVMKPIDLTISGSVEGIMQLVNAPLAADIVDSGETAKANGLREVRTLLDIYPEVVFTEELNDTI